MTAAVALWVSGSTIRALQINAAEADQNGMPALIVSELDSAVRFDAFTARK